MNKLILGRYFPGDSILHQMDARAKLLAGIYFIFVLFIANNWLSYVLLWLFTFFVMRLSGVKFRVYFRGVRPLIWLIIFTVFLQILFTAGGEIYIDWGPITISEFGLINGVYIFSRFVMIIFISTVVTLTTKPIDLTDAINYLLHPLRRLKVPVDEISLMLSISLRFIPNLLDETQKVMDAQRARGTEFGEGSLVQQMKKIVPIFLPLFVSSLNRAEDMANAMEVRGYQSSKPRSSFRRLNWHGRDTIGLLVMVLLTIVLVMLRTEAHVY
ncbi:energy-coupling factor transporter transmembrane component T family protein [Oceanobacillus halophilus]|uniref:Energy-coupling factor transporter transmembrane protein EcfT n=1 Tax=Oceanobacillus halophilus TaxID=930130 RepID=A0A495A328_9BACI|nr:energy-coupling factor transporter transmembrane protein EcfT [Oceanobacillus halophilus]RKQ33925.1 energy-coupling factor transporter transmembrane protein EcfT [Oceanobacillus halophilus]